jgi:hypothetical protein
MAIFHLRFRDWMEGELDLSGTEFHTVEDAVEEALRQAARLIRLRREQGMDYVCGGIFEICDPSGEVLRRVSIAQSLPRFAHGNPIRTFTTGKMVRQDAGVGVYCNYSAGGPALSPKKERP